MSTYTEEILKKNLDEKNNSSNGCQPISLQSPDAGTEGKATMKIEVKNIYRPNTISASYFKSLFS